MLSAALGQLSTNRIPQSHKLFQPLHAPLASPSLSFISFFISFSLPLPCLSLSPALCLFSFFFSKLRFKREHLVWGSERLRLESTWTCSERSRNTAINMAHRQCHFSRNKVRPSYADPVLFSAKSTCADPSSAVDADAGGALFQLASFQSFLTNSSFLEWHIQRFFFFSLSRKTQTKLSSLTPRKSSRHQLHRHALTCWYLPLKPGPRAGGF